MQTAVQLMAVLHLVAAQSVADTQPEVPGNAIVVHGTRADSAEVKQRAMNFVAQTGVANSQKQVARWLAPVCVKVLGLSTAQEAMVEQIMLEVATEAGIRVAGSGCRPNITVSFAADAGQVVRYVHARKPQQFREISTSDREQLLHGNAPVRWWYATHKLDREGVNSNGTTVHIVAAGGEEHISSLPSADGAAVTQQHNGGSNIRTPTVRAIYGVTIVIDAVKIGNASIDAVAAFAAMVAFAEIKASAVPRGSILGLFQPQNGLGTLTDLDRAFLKSLYRLPLDRQARIQRGHLVESLVDVWRAGADPHSSRD